MYVDRLHTRHINKKTTKHICQFKNIRTINVEKGDQRSFEKQVYVRSLKSLNKKNNC